MKHFFKTMSLRGLLLGLFLVPHALFATSLSFEKEKIEVSVGDKVSIPFVLTEDGTAINAFEGSLIYDPEFFTPTAALDGESIISAWIKSLDLKDASAKKGTLLFSGIIPHGLTAGGNIVTVVFTAKKTGETRFSGTGIAYKNDGKGTPIILAPIALPVVVKAAVGSPVKATEKEDTTLPAITRLDIAQNEAMYDGEPFIVFTAKDAESGIDHFELLESKTKLELQKAGEASGWRVVKSPAVLGDSTLSSYVYLKAVDRKGNSSIKELVTRADLSPQSVNNWFSYRTLLGILLVSVFGVLFFFYHRKQGISHESY